MWELDHIESWALKNWCFWTVVLEKTLESPLDCKEIQPINPKGNQSWLFIGRTDPEAETPILWPPDAKSWLIGKDPDAEKEWRQEEKGKQRMRWLDGITDSMTWVWASLGFSEGQGSMLCCSPWGHKDSDRTECLSELNWIFNDRKQISDFKRPGWRKGTNCRKGWEKAVEWCFHALY